MSKEQIEEIFNIIKEKLFKLDYNGDNTIIQTKNVIFQISTLEMQKNSYNPNVSSIDLGECENILKNEYNISDEDSLIVIKKDIKSPDLSLTYVQYEVYHPKTKDQLNLNYCHNIEIVISIPVTLNDRIVSLYDSLSEEGYNLFNSEDIFYNDICSTYTSENGTDIALEDRKKEIYKVTENFTMCQNGCEFEFYNKTTKKAKCNCDVHIIETGLIKNDFSKDKKLNSYADTLIDSNFLVLKCYKFALGLKDILKNKGRIIMTILYIFFIITLQIYNNKVRKKISLYINNIIYLKNFLKNNVNKRGKNELKQNNKKKEKKENKNLKIKIDDRNEKKYKSNEPPKNKLKNKTINYKMINNVNNTNQIINSDMSFKSKRDLKKINDIISIKNSKYNKKFKINLKKKSIKNEIELKKEIINEFLKNKELKYIDLINLNDQELNTLEYDLALIIDKRTYAQYYWSLLKKKQLILFTFLPTNDYNLLSLKLALFILSFSLYFTVKAIFFNNEAMNKIHVNKILPNNGVFNVIFQILKICYSTIVSTVINMILKLLSLSEKNILAIKQENNIIITIKQTKRIEKYIKIKIIIFFILSNILFLFFWYFISCFCAVYRNIQIILIKDTLISFGLSMIYPFGLNFLPGIFRILALRAKNRDKKYLYQINNLIALI